MICGSRTHVKEKQWENVFTPCQSQSKLCAHFDAIRLIRGHLASLLYTSRSTEYKSCVRQRFTVIEYNIPLFYIQKSMSTQLPKALAEHTKYQLDLLDGFSSKSEQLPPGLTKLLQCFRNLCTIVWLLHVRDKLSTAIRKYQARRERSLRVRVSLFNKFWVFKIVMNLGIELTTFRTISKNLQLDVIWFQS